MPPDTTLLLEHTALMAVGLLGHGLQLLEEPEQARIKFGKVFLGG